MKEVDSIEITNRGLFFKMSDGTLTKPISNIFDCLERIQDKLTILQLRPQLEFSQPK